MMVDDCYDASFVRKRAPYICFCDRWKTENHTGVDMTMFCNSPLKIKSLVSEQVIAEYMRILTACLKERFTQK